MKLMFRYLVYLITLKLMDAKVCTDSFYENFCCNVMKRLHTETNSDSNHLTTTHQIETPCLFLWCVDIVNLSFHQTNCIFVHFNKIAYTFVFSFS